MIVSNLLVIGQLPQSMFEDVVETAAEHGESKLFEAARVIHVHRHAWLGSWIDEVSKKMYRYQNGEPTNLRDSGRISGSDEADGFYLDINEVLDSVPVALKEDEQLSKTLVGRVATRSVSENTADRLEVVYGIVMNAETFSQTMNGVMLSTLTETQRMLWHIEFEIRVYIVLDNGTIELRKI